MLLDADGHAVVDPSARPDDVIAEETRPVGERLVLQKHFGSAVEVDIPVGDGGHGGGDSLLLAEVFAGPTGDPLGRAATWTDGIRSVVVGLSGNRSLETGQAVRPLDLDLGPALAELQGGAA